MAKISVSGNIWAWYVAFGLNLLRQIIEMVAELVATLALMPRAKGV